ncbi:NUDIX domain-containing protein [Bacillus nitratireducens]|uniref:NUDIX domain-containing protein n=1 Tax=Bacillus nitratireducens TaxID=2026193 RepID=A0ABU6PKP5_9BACI|nr:NUDIX domain-containing protein [Bacillus nitratireducens]MED4681877.1 NUDIX domain-containing protein [Bacillus nitratireducens]
MATAFLIHQGSVLMMKKEKSKIFNFEFWGGIGGHMESNEINSPMVASYREIEEETGFKKDEIKNFRLKYILLEKNSGEIRQQYVYIGETKHMNFIPSDEGELFWVPKNEILDLYTSKRFWCKDCIYLKEVYRFLMESILMQPFRIVDE